ncbi:sugar-binding protein [Anaerolinea thermophila]|uniref:Carbohydrate-binding domain-containing protein n=1 Tax=Anaerolinea thermophila (strain DSM 14523 / JCM 11388 / NBRC 100420 / UNI-1) TaxID=926569 RepID=E8N1F2_ANATU|nr:sugar-binding protein [Anaerolinea thermophila]BAJ64895.1 hypothetical protein ANT_28690 [Anaerolinea thermophila UNI-1]
MKRLRLLIPVFALLAVMLACNFPSFGRQAQTPTLPPLEQTLAALYQTASAIPPTPTFPPVATATSAPQVSPTPLPPTATVVPPTAVPPTPAPPTPTSPPRRSVVSNATFMSPAPTLDGDWSEWKKVAKEYPATNVVFGKSEWQNEDDLAGSYYVGWDNTYLYLAVKVRDDRYVQTSSGEMLYKGDSIELLLDTDLLGDFSSDRLNGDDFQLGFALGRPEIASGNPETYVWYPSSKSGAPSGVKIAARYEGAIYRAEIAIPWTVFGITPSRGMRLGFALSVSDNDLPGNAVQQSMVSSAPRRALTDPTTWGEVVLK